MAVPILYVLVSALLLATAKTSIIKNDAARAAAARGGRARITDGHPAGVGQFPHQAYVLCDGNTHSAGSLITTTAVLTGAQSTAGFKTWSIRLGGIHRTQEEPTAWIVESAYAIAHPEYETAHFLNDIAVIFLPEEAPLNSFINVVALPSFLEINNTFSGQSALISGWGPTESTSGISETLQWTEVTVIPNSVCLQYFEPTEVTEGVICAGNKHIGICPGDGAAALVVKAAGGFKQIGVASFVPTTGCDSAAPSGYTRVTAYLDWITTTASITDV